MIASALPKHRRRWIIVLFVAVFCLATAGVAWLSRAPGGGSGIRFSFVMPGAGLAGAGKMPPVELSAELAATGATAKPLQLSATGEVVVFVRAEKFSLLMWLHAGTEPLETDRVAFVLFADDGTEIGDGVVQPKVRIAAGKTVSTEIIHPRLDEAARIQLRKLP